MALPYYTAAKPSAAPMTAEALLRLQPPRDTHGFAELAPGLVVEVLSRDDRVGKVLPGFVCAVAEMV